MFGWECGGQTHKVTSHTGSVEKWLTTLSGCQVKYRLNVKKISQILELTWNLVMLHPQPVDFFKLNKLTGMQLSITPIIPKWKMGDPPTPYAHQRLPVSTQCQHLNSHKKQTYFLFATTMCLSWLVLRDPTGGVWWHILVLILPLNPDT